MNYLKKTWNYFSKKDEGNSSQAKTQISPQKDEEQISQEIVQQLFTLTSKLMSSSTSNIPNQKKLQLYGLYKQSIAGDCETEKPGMFDMVAKAKWTCWRQLKGMPKKQAMQRYMIKANQADPEISSKVQKQLSGQTYEEKQKTHSSKAESGGMGLKKVEVIDYSDQYSHPYFKPIQKGLQIQNINRQQLLIKNDSPAVYPLHFAIDKERVQLVHKFIEKLTKQEIESMKDEEQTGILEYAELIQNEEILQMIKSKLEES